MVGSTFANNQTVGRGGALDLEPGSQATVADSTFSVNFASVSGGAVGLYAQTTSVNLASSLVLTSSTLFGNQVGTGAPGGGLYVQGTANATALVRDTIVAGNQIFHGAATDVSGTLDPAGDHNLIGDGTGLTGIENGANGNQIGTAAAPIDPLLGPLADNGGPTQTFALLPGSPAIDAGSNPASLATDQRGAAASLRPGRRHRGIRTAGPANDPVCPCQWWGRPAIIGNDDRGHLQHAGQLCFDHGDRVLADPCQRRHGGLVHGDSRDR